MAMIVVKTRKRGPVYYIVQTLTDETGKRKQHWIPCESAMDAKLLLPEVEAAEKRNEIYEIPVVFRDLRTGAAVKKPLLPDHAMIVEELVKEYIDHHSRIGFWEAATRSGVESICAHYIYPHIGEWQIAAVKTRHIQDFYAMLLTLPTARVSKESGKEFVSPRTVREVHKILRPAFSYAVKQGYLDSNPTLNAELPRMEKYERAQWTEDEIRKAFQCCDDPELRLMIEVMFSCTLRTGELLGLTRDCLHLHPKEGEKPYLTVKQELARLNLKHVEQTKTTVYRVFPPNGPGQQTSMVLKKPKTASSVRNIYMPAILAEKLDRYCREREAVLKENGYPDYQLVFFHDNGRPMSGETLCKRFRNFIRTHGLREVELYSLRHAGATYKLRMTGDIKAVQGDMGHSSTDMLLNVYAGISDEDRQKLADKTEQLLTESTPENSEQDEQQTAGEPQTDDAKNTD